MTRFRGLNRGRGGPARQQYRRIEQHGVFADVTPARPGGLDEQRHERLGDRLARSDLDDVAAVTARDDSKLEAVEKDRTLEAAALERVGVGQKDSKPLELLGGCGKLDLGPERLIEGRLNLDWSKPKRPCPGGSGQQRRNAPTCPWSHAISLATGPSIVGAACGRLPLDNGPKDTLRKMDLPKPDLPRRTPRSRSAKPRGIETSGAEFNNLRATRTVILVLLSRWRLAAARLRLP